MPRLVMWQIWIIPSDSSIHILNLNDETENEMFET